MSRVGNLLQAFLHLGQGAMLAIAIAIATTTGGFTRALGGRIALCRARAGRRLGLDCTPR
jgi:hypothetical protein